MRARPAAALGLACIASLGASLACGVDVTSVGTLRAKSGVDGGGGPGAEAGAGLPPRPPVVTLATSQTSPIHVAASGGTVYWTDYGTGALDGFVVSEPVGGGSQTRLVVAQDPWGLAIHDGYVYWTAYGTGGMAGSISRVPEKGGAIEALALAQTYPWGVVVDSTDVYWTQREYMNGSVRSTPSDSDGGPVPAMLATALFSPTGLALAGGRLYWTEYIAGGHVYSVPTGGGAPSVVAAGEDHPFAIATDATSVYWSTTQAIVKAPLSGGPATTLATSSNRIIELAVDSRWVYWTDYYAGVVLEVPIEGGEVLTLASGLDEPYGVSYDDAHVYWTTLGDGTVEQMAKWP